MSEAQAHLTSTLDQHHTSEEPIQSNHQLTQSTQSTSSSQPPQSTSPPELSADAIASLITQVPQGGPVYVPRPKGRSGTVKKKKKKDDSTTLNKSTSEPLTEETQLSDQPDETQSLEDSQRTGTIQTGGDLTLVDSTELDKNVDDEPSKGAVPSITGATTSVPVIDPSAKIAPSIEPLTSPASTAITPESSAPGRNESKKIKQTKSKKLTALSKKTKKRTKLIELFLPCFVSNAHEDEVLTSRSNTSKPISQTFEAINQANTNLPSSPTSATSDLSTPQRSLSKRTPVETARHLRNKMKKSPTLGSSPPRSRRTGSDGALPIPVSDTVTPAGAAAAASAANAGGGGVKLPEDETEGVLSGAVVPPGTEGNLPKKTPSSSRLLARNHSHADSLGKVAMVDETEAESVEDEDDDLEDSEDDEEDRIVAMGGMGIPVGEDGVARPLLAPLDLTVHQGRKCLVLDLDETLVHSSFKTIPQSDFVVPVEIENAVHNVYVIKRPGVDEFMRKMGEIYEVVVFTASLSKYADPVLDMLDIHHVVKHRLFRESCYNHKGNYVKDLSQLGRPIGDTIIIDNSPASYIFHPSNAVPVSSWFNDPHDTELADLAAFLADIANVPDVRTILDPRL
ncbi:hypothetical protein DFH28DRAFT_1121176 [Melampsora americana]|nr:hypothetical protein DFH28DRAFT_1121176 [Melampsora americana]